MTTSMTTSTIATSAHAAPDEPPARFRDLVAAEWLKLRSLRSTRWAFLITALTVIAFNAGTAYDTYRHWSENNARDRAAFIRDGIPLQEAFNTNAGLVLALAASAIGALAITGEYSTGLIRTTFAAVPARRSVMAAKTCVLAAAMTLFGLAVAATSFGLTQAILSQRDAGVSIGYPGAWRVVIASALLAPVCALIGAALGAILRSTAAAIVSSVVLLQMLPLVVTDSRHWTAILDHALPFNAWMRLVDIPYDTDGIAYPWATTGAWTVLAIWALTAATLTITIVQHRDQ